MGFISEPPIPDVYKFGTPVMTVHLSCYFIFKISTIFVADAFDNGSCPVVDRPFVFSSNIFCPATVPGLKFLVNGILFQMTTGDMTAGDPDPAPAPAPADAMFMLGWFGSGKSGGADELLQRFLDINVQSEVVLNEVSAQTIVVWVCAQMSRF